MYNGYNNLVKNLILQDKLKLWEVTIELYRHDIGLIIAAIERIT